MDERDDSGLKFAHGRLPWLLMGIALILYISTLNTWVTLLSLPTVAKVLGWDWSPAVNSPVHFLLTLPFRLLPASVQVIGLNLLSAIMAALTMGLLCRTVALLPHDRTREQRQKLRNDEGFLEGRMAIIPPVFAFLICGLQLTFWEHATAATGEMLDLLIFAYCIRCLMEYRAAPRESWFYKLAFIYGLGVTNNVAMIGFFPCFLIAVIRLRGLSFFQFGFLSRMIGLGFAGLLLYLLLPAVSTAAGTFPGSYMSALRYELGMQKALLLGFPKSRILLLSLTSLVPLAVVSIRWPSTFGDTSVAGALITSLLLRLVHLGFLVAAIFVSFDFRYSPRELGEGFAFLPFYYLGALVIGYCSGYFLLIYSEGAGRSRRQSRTSPLIGAAVAVLVILAAAGSAGYLLTRTIKPIQANRTSALKDFAMRTAASLPAINCVVLADGAVAAILQKAIEGTTPSLPRHTVVDTGALQLIIYQRALMKQDPGLFPANWAELLASKRPGESLGSEFQMQWILFAASKYSLWYLHPSFGLYFEAFYQRPRGLACELTPYSSITTLPPPASKEEARMNEDFWNSIEPSFESLLKARRDKSPDASIVAGWYSRGLNSWAVAMQRNGDLKAAEKHLKAAVSLNPENATAKANLDLNTTLQSGKRMGTVAAKSFDELYGPYRTWDARIAAFGPLDEPNLAAKAAEVLSGSGLYRQAAGLFTRVIELEPANLDARFWLANMYYLGRLSDPLLATVREIRSHKEFKNLPPSSQVEALRLEAMAYHLKGDTTNAVQLLNKAHKDYPEDETVLDSLSKVYLLSGDIKNLTNALQVLNEQLKSHPNNGRALLNVGAIHIQLKEYARAIPLLDRAIELLPDKRGALLNRAIAHLHLDHLDAAKADYEALEKDMSGMFAVYYGLAEIATRKKDKGAIIKNLELYLQNAPRESIQIDSKTGKAAWQVPEERKDVERRLKELKG